MYALIFSLNLAKNRLTSLFKQMATCYYIFPCCPPPPTGVPPALGEGAEAAGAGTFRESALSYLWCSPAVHSSDRSADLGAGSTTSTDDTASRFQTVGPAAVITFSLFTYKYFINCYYSYVNHHFHPKSVSTYSPLFLPYFNSHFIIHYSMSHIRILISMLLVSVFSYAQSSNSTQGNII